MPFGTLLNLIAKNTTWAGKASALPLELIQQLKMVNPIPITVGGSNNGTWTLNASVSNPVILWNGDEPIILKSTVVYTWNATSNAILDSDGAADTDVDSVLGIWYMYINQAGDTLVPSQTAPVYAEAPNNAGVLGHPGTSRTQFYRYVGVHVCTTAATPAFLATKKVGFTYHFASTSEATSATWGALDFTDRVPAIEGIKVAGQLETGTEGTAMVSGSSVQDCRGCG